MNKPTIFCDINTKKWLNLEEAIAYIGYGSKDTFQNWREEGKLNYYRPGKIVLYKRTDLDKFIEQHKVNATL